jgi:diaminopimelate epimerase
MRFTKMHGLGNDYVYINCLVENVENPEELAVKISNRHFGVGADGLILIYPSEVADFKMKMYNSDGSRGEMCGNGIRCVGKYVFDYGLTNKKKITVETLAGIKTLNLIVDNRKVVQVKVDMGKPILDPKEIPIKMDEEVIISKQIEVGGEKYKITGVSMGNPHVVVFLHEMECFLNKQALKLLSLEKIGPLFEHHKLFPNRINTEFVEVLDRENVKMRVWERGSGETMACGTGACAVAVACSLNGFTDDVVKVHLLGGELLIEWDREKDIVYMTGPAVTVFDGELNKGFFTTKQRN